MTTTIAVGALKFGFPNQWQAHQYDAWSFYRNQLEKTKVRGGVKAIDLLVLDADGTGWFIEVKDYRAHARTKPSDIADEFAEKVFDTLAALLPAKVNANDAGEQEMATAVLGAGRLRVVLHLEQPLKHSRLRPRAINPADVMQQLKRLLKPVDAHPFVAEKARMGSLPWKVV